MTESDKNNSDPRPQIIQDTGFEFDWDDKKVWELPVETEEMPIDGLLWHLEIPVWEREGTDDWNLTPKETLNNMERESNHAKKIEESNLEFPIDIMWNKGKWTLLDGYHRLAHAYQLGHKTVKVRKIPRDCIPKITVKLWKDYRPSKDPSKQTAEVYNKIGQVYADEFSEPSFCIDYFLKYVSPGGKILDVGCGPGRDANYLASKGLKVKGVDLSEEMIKLAQKKYPNIDFKVADMRSLEYPENSFDGVFASFSLIHVPKIDIPNVLQNFNVLLKTNGVLFIAIQEGKSEEIYLPEPFKPDEEIFLNIISRQELKKLLMSAGFETVRFFGRKPKKGKGEFEFTKYVIIAKK